MVTDESAGDSCDCDTVRFGSMPRASRGVDVIGKSTASDPPKDATGHFHKDVATRLRLRRECIYCGLSITWLVTTAVSPF